MLTPIQQAEQIGLVRGALLILRMLPPHQLIRCLRCNGEQPNACGCEDGTMRVREAIDEMETEGEILSK